jgi:hypothetical protein
MKRHGRVSTALAVTGVVVAAYAYGALSHEHRWFPTPQIERALRKRLWLVRERRGFKNTAGREEVPCERFRQPGTAILLTMGQSNAANEGEFEPGYQPGPNVFNFNFFDGKCYVARDPLLGGTGAGGSPWTRLGDALVAAGRFERVLIVPIAVGGSAIREWAKGGVHYGRIAEAQRALDRQGLRVTHVLWHQGEADARSTSHAQYVAAFRSVLDGIRSAGITAPVYVATASICKNQGSEAIRSAQHEIVATLDNVRAGPDTDQLDRFRWRFDLCHFSKEGLAEHARLWFEVLQKPDE